jgi:hypothetical protein
MGESNEEGAHHDPPSMMRFIQQARLPPVMFSAPTLNTRRDDYSPPADKPTAQADEKEKKKFAYRRAHGFLIFSCVSLSDDISATTVAAT